MSIIYTPIYTLDQLHDSERLHSSKTLVQSSVLRSREEFYRDNDAIIFSHRFSHTILGPLS